MNSTRFVQIAAILAAAFLALLFVMAINANAAELGDPQPQRQIEGRPVLLACGQVNYLGLVEGWGVEKVVCDDGDCTIVVSGDVYVLSAQITVVDPYEFGDVAVLGKFSTHSFEVFVSRNGEPVAGEFTFAVYGRE